MALARSEEYASIARHYGDRIAKRSGRPLISHIDEGLLVLEELDTTLSVKRAWCLHPLVQEDSDLEYTWRNVRTQSWDLRAVLLAMEYRHIANAYLSSRVNDHPITLSPLAEVQQMLIADKVQNRKDFLARFDREDVQWASLNIYFCDWLRRLEVTPQKYDHLCALIDGGR